MMALCTKRKANGQITGPGVREIEFLHDTAAKKIDIRLRGSAYATFMYSESLEKPVFFPVYAPGGTTVTRGFPIDPEEGERIDHPHHSGVWFNYGSVNGLDFWNNSSSIPAERKCSYGRIACIKDSVKTDTDRGTLKAYCIWEH